MKIEETFPSAREDAQSAERVCHASRPFHLLIA